MLREAGALKGTIKSKTEMERLFRAGRRSSSYLMGVIVSEREGDARQGRCAFVAGKKLGNAPTRNRCKRVLRQGARELGAPWPGYDVVFVARRKIAHAAHTKVVSQMSRQLGDLGVAS